MKRYLQNPSARAKKAVSFMGYMYDDVDSVCGIITPGETACVRRHRFLQVGTSDVALSRGHHEEAEQPPKLGRTSKVNHQRCTKKIRTEFFSGHVARATDVHEQVTNDKPSISGTSKEAARNQ
jgi:hypothetical protein